MNSTGRPFFQLATTIGVLGLLSLTGSARAASPIIVEQPQNQIVGSGEIVRFSVVAESDLPLNYQWLFNSTSLSGATNSTLILSNVQPSQTGKYSVLVANSAATNASLEAFLEVCWEVQLTSFEPGVLSNVLEGTFSKFDLTGNLYVAKTLTNSSGFSILKLTQARQQSWEVSFYTANDFRYLSCRGLVIDSAGRICVVGVTATNWYSDLEDIIVWKLDTGGTQLWSSRYQSAGLPHAIAVDAAANIYVAGTISEGINGNGGSKQSGGTEITKFNASGQRGWQATYDEAEPGALATDLSGNVYVAGMSGASPVELVLGKYDNTGNRLWFTRQSVGDIYAPSCLLIDSQTNLIVGLSFWSLAPFDTHGTIKYDQNGKMLWTVYNSEPSNIEATGGWMLDPFNNLYFGIVRFVDDAVMCNKYDPDGNQLWATVNLPKDAFSFSGYGIAIGIDPEQNLLFAGQSETGVLAVLRYQQNLVPGRPVIHGAIPSRRVASGTTITFNPLVTGESPLTYQWRQDGLSLPDATNAVLVLTNVTPSNNGNYSVIVTNIIGCSVSAPSSLTAVDVQPFYFQDLSVDASNVTLHFVGEAGRLYWLEVSTNLTDWSELVGFGIDANLIIQKGNQSPRFFRVQTIP